ncbi:MAG: DVUA0089 family protein, partial [Pontixanthobacter sp.]
MGAIDTAGDSDWFRITLAAGETYTFTTYLPGGGLSDSILTLRDSSGRAIATNDDANTAAQLLYSEITFTAAAAGTYFLDVTGYQSAIGAFFLSSSRPVRDDVAGSTATTASLTVGANPVQSTLSVAGDRDWYAVTLTAGETYNFTTGATGGSNDFDTTLTLRDASGNVLAFNDDNAGTYSGVRFTASASGTYYVDVGSYVDSEAGDYRLTASVAEPLAVFTNDQIADQLVNGFWGGPDDSRAFAVRTGGVLAVNVSGLTDQGRFLARNALELWGDALGIRFFEVETGGRIIFDDNEDGAFSSSERVDNIITSSRVNISTGWLASQGTTLDSYSFQTYLHEIGHALGLGHAGNYNSNANYGQDAQYLNDSWATTVMSYFDQRENSFFNDQGFDRAFVITPMVADILALQTLYGATTTTRIGDDIYGVGNTTGRV